MVPLCCKSGQPESHHDVGWIIRIFRGARQTGGFWFMGGYAWCGLVVEDWTTLIYTGNHPFTSKPPIQITTSGHPLNSFWVCTIARFDHYHAMGDRNGRPLEPRFQPVSAWAAKCGLQVPLFVAFGRVLFWGPQKWCFECPSTSFHCFRCHFGLQGEELVKLASFVQRRNKPPAPSGNLALDAPGSPFSRPFGRNARLTRIGSGPKKPRHSTGALALFPVMLATL